MIDLLPFRPVFGLDDHKEIVDKIGDLGDKKKELDKRSKSGRGRESGEGVRGTGEPD